VKNIRKNCAKNVILEFVNMEEENIDVFNVEVLEYVNIKKEKIDVFNAMVVRCVNIKK